MGSGLAMPQYNYFRYYDPSTGRYITSDPVGLQGGLNTYGYALQNPVMYYDDSGNSAVHAIRGAWWTGTRVGAGINYGIQAATGASLGILLYETFNDGIDFGDAANDDTYEQCPLDVPDDCDLERARIIKKEIAIKNDIQSGSPRFGPNAGNEILWASTIKAKKKAWNEWVNDYNRRCPRKIGRRFKL